MEDEETFCECVAFKMLRLNLDYLINIHVISNMFIQMADKKKYRIETKT